ncbi:MAG: guanylate kinase [candidate division Zixibacteria bacterium]|nr:guanylate kinase [candidate division Zixibacteria bacterium]
MIKPGLAVVISSPSGTGKTTICHRLIGDYGDYQFSVSATTRQPRGEEKDGVDYYFMAEDEFLKSRTSGKFIETAQYLNCWYGTPLAPLEKAVDQGKIILLDIDVQGGKSIKDVLPQAVMIFLVPPGAAELEKRLSGRKTEDQSRIKKRLDMSIKELGVWIEYDYIIVNDDLDRAVSDVHEIIKAERHKTSRLADKKYWKKSLIELLGLNGNRR